jgi:hypothetical protein
VPKAKVKTFWYAKGGGTISLHVYGEGAGVGLLRMGVEKRRWEYFGKNFVLLLIGIA